MRPTSAKCGHVKRRLKRNEPLTGKVLEFALSVIGESSFATGDDLLRRMAAKLRAGEQLSNYELHIMVDVLLLHKRFEGGEPLNSTTVELVGSNDQREFEVRVTPTSRRKAS